jgi:uncharacterized protein (DUF58 family)
MAALLIVIGLILRERAIFALAASILTVIPVAWWWKWISLRGVDYERHLDKRRAFPGEHVDMTIQITNRKLVPLSWLEISDEIPMALPLADGVLMPTHIPRMGSLQHVASLRWYERLSRHYRLLCTQRGVYNLGRVHLRSGDLFTLFEERQERAGSDELIVFPRIWPVTDLGLPSKEPFGEPSAPRCLIQDPLSTVGVRDYRPEDDLRHVHWKATAHKGDLQVRVYEPTATLDLVILLNVTTFEHHWQGVLPELLERTINVAGSIATWAIGEKHKVGLVTNGCLVQSDQPARVPPGRAPEQLTVILEMLAGVTSFAVASIESVLRRESPRLPWGATLVVVTAIVTDRLAEVMIDLRDAGRRLALISLEEDSPPPLRGIVTYHLPSSAPFFEHLSNTSYDATEVIQVAGLLPVATYKQPSNESRRT